MYDQNENFDFSRSEHLKPKKMSKSDTEYLSQDNIEAHKQQLERIFTKLIIFGLGMGLIMSIVTIFVMNKFGLVNHEKENRELPADKQIELPNVERS
jgi:hypothetical protein